MLTSVLNFWVAGVSSPKLFLMTSIMSSLAWTNSLEQWTVQRVWLYLVCYESTCTFVYCINAQLSHVQVSMRNCSRFWINACFNSVLTINFSQSGRIAWPLALPHSTHLSHPLIITFTDWFWSHPVIGFIFNYSLHHQSFTLSSIICFVLDHLLCPQSFILYSMVCFINSRLLHFQSFALYSIVHFVFFSSLHLLSFASSVVCFTNGYKKSRLPHDHKQEPHLTY